MEKIPDGIITKLIIGGISLLVGLVGYFLVDSYQRVRSSLDVLQHNHSILERRFESVFEESIRNRAVLDKLAEISRERGERLARIEVLLEQARKGR